MCAHKGTGGGGGRMASYGPKEFATKLCAVGFEGKLVLVSINSPTIRVLQKVIGPFNSGIFCVHDSYILPIFLLFSRD